MAEPLKLMYDASFLDSFARRLATNEEEAAELAIRLTERSEAE